MAMMIPLNPAPSAALPGDGWALIATEAGRYGDGLRATLNLHNGVLQDCRQVSLAQPQSKKWREFVSDVAQRLACEAPAVEAVILQLPQAIEVILQPKPRSQPQGNAPTGRPEIQVNGRFDREIIADAIDVLLAVNDPPTLFMRGTEWVSVAPAALQAEVFTVPRLRVLVGDVADCITITHEEGGEVKSPSRLPFPVCQDFLAGSLVHAFPPLAGIRLAPVFLPDGRLLATEGYDPASGFLLRLGDLRDIREDMPKQEALTWLFEELFVDFPIADDPSKAHLLALLLEPFVRPIIGSNTPLYLIDASTRGSGKGLLAHAASVVATGGNAHVMALTGEAEEHDKRITALLMSGVSWILLDNVTALDSAALCAALTANLWRGRLLGASKMVQVPNDATWVATGNNVRLSSEMARRVIPIRLEPSEERPEERTRFKHTTLLEWAQRHRGELVSACLSLIRAWIDADRPKGAKTLGGFESWACVMGGILKHAGIKGFLEGRETLHADSDHDTPEWRAICDHWWTSYETLPVTAKNILAIAKANELLLPLWAGRKEIAALQRIGHALRGMRGRVFTGHRICPAGRDSATKNAAFCLLPIMVQGKGETPETPQDAGKQEDSQNQHHAKHPEKTPLNRGVFDPAPIGLHENTHDESSVLSNGSGVFGVSGVFRSPPAINSNHQKMPAPSELCPTCGHCDWDTDAEGFVICIVCAERE